MAVDEERPLALGRVIGDIEELLGNKCNAKRIARRYQCCVWPANFLPFHGSIVFGFPQYLFICLSAYLLICVAKKSQHKKRKNIGHRLKIKKPGTSAVFQCLSFGRGALKSTIQGVIFAHLPVITSPQFNSMNW